MATIVLSAVGAAAGASIGGSVLGLTSTVIGRAVGATLGQVVDRAVFGASIGGSDPVETGKIDRFRLSGASEGTAQLETFGRVRVGGQVIWSSPFIEHVRTTSSGGSGKGGSNAVQVREHSYSISLAVALGAGRVGRLGRIWADGTELDTEGLNFRFYEGSETQLPDPKIQSVEGTEAAPAYRGTSYVVFEDLDLSSFGSRVPQFSFEIVRPDQEAAENDDDITRRIKSVALIPGTGEYALATTPVHYSTGPGQNTTANVHAPGGLTDFATSLNTLDDELPNLGATSLVVGWFANDLRCGSCQIQPKVEQADADGVGMPWTVSGLDRTGAQLVPKADGRSIYGGTPSDQSVVEAIAATRAAGKAVMFYPFLFMDQLNGNSLPDPWSDEPEQPALPWRGRITLSVAPGQSGSPDGTAAADAEVAAFFGQASAADFVSAADSVAYAGPPEFSYRRYVLHYAHLCAVAGGVDAFCIGSEMRALTQIMGATGDFPAVEALRLLAADVRSILGPDTKIGYAADWSEYFGYHPQDGSGDVFFHLDPLWADDEIDFIGIDNYMPLADWRAGFDHADASFGSTYDLAYLRQNIEGGEGFDWYYIAPESRAAQNRTPIADDAHGEPWVYRYKDIRSWWSNRHHERVGGVRQPSPTQWVPESKPIWFTELGCPAVDKGANQPNVFEDEKSSESALPYYSSGRRDDLIQHQFLNAVLGYWAGDENNPQSSRYDGSMIDTSRVFVWAWDTRPFPQFPNNTQVWSDGEDYRAGHWINGRLSARSLASVVREISAKAGVTDIDVSELYGLVKGYSVDTGETARATMQPLMLAYDFDAIEKDGKLVFRTRTGVVDGDLEPDTVAVERDADGTIERSRASGAERSDRLQVTYVEADGDYETRAEFAALAEAGDANVAVTDLPLVLTRAEARELAERWLAQSGVSRDRVRFSLPPSRLDWSAGDLITLPNGHGSAHFRIESVEQGPMQNLEAVRVERTLLEPKVVADELPAPPTYVSPVPVEPVYLDLPLITGEETPHAPHIAVTAEPWPGDVAVYSSPSQNAFTLNRVISARATMGETLTPLFQAAPGLWDRGDAVRVRLFGGSLSSVGQTDVLNGANAVAIGDGASDIWEVFQFTTAELVDADTYDLTGRLRGQLGTDALIPPDWPPGSRIVLLNAALAQIDLPSSARGLARYFRAGPAKLGYDHPAYVETQRAFGGVGLRPYAPAHVRARGNSGADIEVSWIRRTRTDGDSWAGTDVPLGEDVESYRLRVTYAGGLVREELMTSPSWTYTAADQTADGVSAPFTIDVAQMSARFGAGLEQGITINV